MVPSVSAPRLWSPVLPPPALTVTADDVSWVAVELSESSGLLDPARASERSAEAFWASWESVPLLPPGSVTPPTSAWGRLAQARRLFYRAHVSLDPNRWTAHQTTTPDDSVATAPSIRMTGLHVLQGEPDPSPMLPGLLQALAVHPSFAMLGDGPLDTLVGVHRFSARRPFLPDDLEWFVLTVAGDPGQRIATVVRFAFDSLVPLGFRMARESPAPSPGTPGGSPEERRAAAWGVSLGILGPFRVYQDLAPSPGDAGGTWAAAGPDEVVSYFATCSWAGPRTVLPA
jgi:hypothetical protein